MSKGTSCWLFLDSVKLLFSLSAGAVILTLFVLSHFLWPLWVLIAEALALVVLVLNVVASVFKIKAARANIKEPDR